MTKRYKDYTREELQEILLENGSSRVVLNETKIIRRNLHFLTKCCGNLSYKKVSELVKGICVFCKTCNRDMVTIATDLCVHCGAEVVAINKSKKRRCEECQISRDRDYSADYYTKNTEKAKAASKLWTSKNREINNEYCRKSYARNISKHKKRMHDYSQKPEVIKRRKHKRMELKYGDFAQVKRLQLDIAKELRNEQN